MSFFEWTLPGETIPPGTVPRFSAAAYVRMLINLLPPGKVWHLLAGSGLHKMLEGCADELARIDARVRDLLDEDDPRTIDELLPEAERELDLDVLPISTVGATLDTTTLEDPDFPAVGVARWSGGVWSAILRWIGAGGNGKVLAIRAQPTGNFVEARVDESPIGGAWNPAVGTIGLWFGNDGGGLTLAMIEAQLVATGLIEIATPDASGSEPQTEDLIEYSAAFAGEINYGGIEERRARVIARRLARQRYRPIDFQTALASLLGQDADDVVVIETSHAQAVAVGDAREIYRFFIYRDPTLPGVYYLDAAQQLVDDIAASHTRGYVIESVDFLTDDPYSLTDRDVLGV